MLRSGRRLSACATALGALIAWTTASAQEPPAASAQETPAASVQPGPATYVGSEACQMCHEDITKAFLKNPHYLMETDKKYNRTTKACEACHGPGSRHVDSMIATDIRNPVRFKPADADHLCLTCHFNRSTHVGWINDSHAKAQMSCVGCHTIHRAMPEGGLVPRRPIEVNQLCITCHATIWASFQRPYGHRLAGSVRPEANMSCVDCHNPHGSVFPRNRYPVNANDPGCFKCHGDKRGPFTFEHAPVRLDGCTACHEPHGSANPRMLTRPQVAYVCLECHANLPVPAAPLNRTLGTVPPAFHDLRQPRFQNCTLCHQKVHGSYVNRELLR